MTGRLGTPRYRQAFDAYARVLAERFGAQRAAVRLKRDIAFFEKMDSALPDPRRGDEVALIALFGTMGVRRLQMQIDHSIRTGLIPPITQDSLAVVRRRAMADAIIARSRGECYHDVLIRFRDNMETVARRWERRGWTSERRWPHASSLSERQRSAEAFLKTIADPGVAIIGVIGPDAFSRFLADHPGQLASVTPFIRYLNRHEATFASLRVPTMPKHLTQDAILPADFVADVVATCLDPAVPAKAALIVLRLLYAQRPFRMARFRLTDLKRVRDNVHRLTIRSDNEMVLDGESGGSRRDT